MTSCKKEYTCACTATDTFWNSTYKVEMKKKDAETWCDNYQAAGVAATIAGFKCELK